MKLGKKLLASGCALALTLSMGVTAFAAEQFIPNKTGSATLDGQQSNTEDINVQLTAQNVEGGMADVYSVEVSYENLLFEYEKTPAKWEPESHTYTAAGEGTWKQTSKEVAVKNHSNKEVYAKVELLNDTGTSPANTQSHNGVTINLTNEGLDGTTVIAAENVTEASGSHVAGECDKTATVSVSGVPSQDMTQETGAKVKVTVSSTAIAAA